mgnify:CR=1 FL=1
MLPSIFLSKADPKNCLNSAAVTWETTRESKIEIRTAVTTCIPHTRMRTRIRSNDQRCENNWMISFPLFSIAGSGANPAFFSGVSQFYSYLFDGRSNRIMRCVFDVLSETEDHRYKIMMYMNYKDFQNYQNCENTYYGYIEHYDAMTHITLTNQDTPMEKASVQVLASYLDCDTKWGLFNGFSSRPMMPIAIKMLLSKTRLKEDEDLIRLLKVSREDVRLLKLYNMLSVT